MEPERILIVLPADILGGAEQVLKQIANYYLTNGHEVDVFFLKESKSGDWDNISNKARLYYTNANRERSGMFKVILNFREVGAKKVYDYAYTSHTHTTALVGFLRKIGWLSIGKLIARESTSVFLRYKGINLLAAKLCYLTGYKNTDLVICQTELMRKQLFEGMPDFFRKLKNIAVISNPITIATCQTTFARPYGKKYIVTAGRLIHEKGFDILIEAFKRMHFAFSDMHLLILGSGKKRQELHQLIVQNKLENKVSLIGHVANVLEYFKYAELCVVSSRVEGFPNVLLQMMSQNSRIVATRCAGGIEEIDGLVTCEPNDAQALSSAIEFALSNNYIERPDLLKIELQNRSIEVFISKVNELTHE